MMGSDCRHVSRKMIETELYFMKDPVANCAEGKIREKIRGAGRAVKRHVPIQGNGEPPGRRYCH